MAIAIVAALGCGVLAAQELPLGPEFQANTYTTGAQSYSAVATADDGSYVVVWDSVGQDGSGHGIFGQRYSSVGSKLGVEFRVNTYTTGNQEFPLVAAGGDGSFVVVRTSVGQDGSPSGVFGQRFGLLPGPIPKFGQLGSEFPINAYTPGSQVATSVATDRNGNFVVVWTDLSGQDGSGYGVFGRRFDGAGNPLGADFSVASNTLGNQISPAVEFDGAGNFVVVWAGSYNGSEPIAGQRFDPSGNRIGGEFSVSASTSGDFGPPGIAVAQTGEFFVVWDNEGLDGSGSTVLGRRFDASAQPTTPAFQVNSYTTYSQTSPAVSVDRDGNFLVVWISGDQDGDKPGIFGQRFDRVGGRIGNEFPINVHTTGSQTFPRVAAGGNGFVVVWDSDGQDGSDYGVFGRREDRVAQALVVDSRTANGTSSDANGVFEPGETVLVGPSWSNASPGTLVGFAGTAASFTGPTTNNPTYGLPDVSADYGSVPSGALASCDDASPDACYRLTVSGGRPGTHWDGVLVENVTFGGGHAWTLHLGDSFTDVPRTQPFYKKIETMLHHGITSGCGPALYCPGQAIPRDQMAIFVAKGVAGSAERIPAAGTLEGQPYDCSSGGVSRFSDVLPTDTACKHIHYIAVQNVTLGCSPTQYCPTATVTRDAMASFIAKGIVAPGGGGAVPVTYTDSGTGRSYSCDAGSPNLHFTDVGVSSPFCKHIHFLWAKGIVDGCSATTYCPGAPVNRDAMAKFIANGFGLQLYGP